MMNHIFRSAMGLALAGTAFVGAVLTASMPAEARIVCKDGYQVIEGGRLLSTPYCADNQVAAVAREYGMHVSDAAVRNNPSIKEEACRLVGNDIRVRDACANYMPESERDWFH